MVSAIPLIGGIPAGPELLIILLVLVLLFGANKIPKLARSTGQAMGEFKKGREQVEDELKEMQEGGDDATVDRDATVDPDTTTDRDAAVDRDATTDRNATEDEDLETETERSA